MKTKAMYPLAFVVVAAAMFVTSTLAQMVATGQTVQSSNSTGSNPVNPGALSATTTILNPGVVSWRFKPLGSWPFVMITSPADKVLMTSGIQTVKDWVDIRVKVWDDKGVTLATMQIDGGQAVPMGRIGDTQMWSARFDATKVSDGDYRISVNVVGAGGNTDQDAITVMVNQAGNLPQVQRPFGPVGNSVGS